MTEVGGQRAGEVDQRWPQPVQALQHDRVPVGEQREHPVVGDLVADQGPVPTAARIAPLGHDGAVLGDADERRAQAAPREQLVDRVEGEQVPESRAGRPPRRRRRGATSFPELLLLRLQHLLEFSKFLTCSRSGGRLHAKALNRYTTSFRSYDDIGSTTVG